MATPNKTGKNLAEFNVKNGVYSIDGGTPKPLTWMNTFTKDRSVNTTLIYGDGEVQVSLASDTTISGAIGTTARDMEFEQDLGLSIELADGSVGELAVTAMPKIDFGFETEFIGKDGIKKTKKVWVLNVQVSPPNTSLTQTQDNITQSTTDYNYTGYGVNAKKSAGSDEDYIDTKTGLPVRVYTVSKTPDNADFETFLDSVPKPTMPTANNA